MRCRARSLRKALAGHDGEEWRKALDVELNKFKKFDVFEEVDEREHEAGRKAALRPPGVVLQSWGEAGADHGVRQQSEAARGDLCPDCPY